VESVRAWNFRLNVDMHTSTSARTLGLLAEAREATRTGRGTRIRDQLRLSQGEVARAIAVAPATVSRWEAGVRQPSGESAIRYARLLRALEAQAGGDDGP